MEERLKAIRSSLAKMASQEAADWILENYPAEKADYGDAIVLMSHLSLKRADQARLARHYFQRAPFANAKVYQVLSSFMSLGLFASVIRENLPKNEADKSLLLYHLAPVLEKAAKSADDREMVKSLIAEIQLA